MLKPYELTEEELLGKIKKLPPFQETEYISLWNITPSRWVKFITYAAQKKMLEHLIKQAEINTIWATPTHVGVKGLPPEYFERMLKDFGIEV